MKRGLAGIGLLAAAIALTGCDEPAPDLAEWTVADHDHQKREAPRRRAPSTHAEPSEKNQVIDVTWIKQCASCHGRKGRGDGPGAVMMKARDFTLPAWQASVTDQQMAEVIRKGRDKMPAFNLPDSIVQGLVAHIRTLEVETEEGAATSEAAGHGVTGTPSAPPAPSGAARTAPAAAQPEPEPEAEH